MRKRNFTGIILAGVMMLAGAMTLSAQTGVEDVRWKLVELNGQPQRNSPAFIELDKEAKRLSGSTSCNELFGGYTLSQTAFKASGIGSTKRACLGLRRQQTEAAMLKALGDATRIERAGDELTVFSGDSAVMKFKAAGGSGSEAALGQSKWELTAIDGTAIDLKTEVPFINFETEKRGTGGNGGCNTFGGSYTADGSNIKFGKLMMTMMACSHENRSQIEMEMMDGLRLAENYSIADGKLTISGGGSVLEFKAVKK